MSRCKSCEYEKLKKWRATPAGKDCVRRVGEKQRASPESAEKHREWRRQNPDRIRRYQKRYRDGNSDVIKAKAALKRPARAAQNADARRKWLTTESGRNSSENWVHRRRAHKEAVVSTLTADQWAAIKDYFGGCCAYCGKQAKRMSMEHVIPISQGGEHSESNVVPACLSCNCSKGSKSILIWLRDRHLTLHQRRIQGYLGRRKDDHAS